MISIIRDPKRIKRQHGTSYKDNPLAPNQVEFDGQVFVMGDKAENSTICINPTILQHTKETVLDIEGCLSSGIYVKVQRPKEILAEWYDENLEKKQAKIEGYSVKCFLHEWTYKVIYPTFCKLKWDMATRKQKNLRMFSWNNKTATLYVNDWTDDHYTQFEKLFKEIVLMCVCEMLLELMMRTRDAERRKAKIIQLGKQDLLKVILL